MANELSDSILTGAAYPELLSEYANGNREYKDSVFCFLFGNEKYKELTLSLYNAMNHTQYDDPSLISIKTLKDVIYVSVKNDVAFLIKGTFNFYEHQSTFNPNMPIRMLIYAAREFDRYLIENKLNVFSGKRITLPVPKFICFYNGESDQPDIKDLRLSDLYDKNVTPAESDLELTVHMFNINYDHNDALLSKCHALQDYSLFVCNVRKFIKANNLSANDNIAPAITRAIDSLPENSIIKPILLLQKSEVIDMCITEYTREKELEFHKAEVEEAKREGIEEGVEETQILTAGKMLTEGFSDDTIIYLSGISRENLEKIKAENAIK